MSGLIPGATLLGGGSGDTSSLRDRREDANLRFPLSREGEGEGLSLLVARCFSRGGEGETEELLDLSGFPFGVGDRECDSDLRERRLCLMAGFGKGDNDLDGDRLEPRNCFPGLRAGSGDGEQEGLRRMRDLFATKNLKD